MLQSNSLHSYHHRGSDAYGYVLKSSSNCLGCSQRMLENLGLVEYGYLSGQQELSQQRS